MTLKMNSNRQSNVTSSWNEKTVVGKTRMIVPRVRRAYHQPVAFLAEAILVSASGDVNLNLGLFADDFAGVASNANANVAIFAEGAAMPWEPSDLGVVRVASALDDEDEDEDKDVDYDDDEVDEDDDDLDEEDDEEFEDDDLDDEDELDDDLDDEEEDDEDEDEE